MLPANHAVPAALRAGQRVRDAEFDAVYPDDVRRVSARFWTPIDVAATAGRWLKALGATSVLDVGSGAGKFCIVANLTAGVTVAGVEQRSHLIEAAQAATTRYQAEARYLHGTLETIDPTPFDAFYLFNPFGENLYHPAEQFDDKPELSALRYLNDLSIVEHWLDHAPVNTCFVTYHGFGGRIPSTYVLTRATPKGSDHLRLWMKKRAGSADSFTLEVEAARSQAGKLAEQRTQQLSRRKR
ncbi:MAG: class I SAM-dependent methyltransferase [Polyangiales bacterium]